MGLIIFDISRGHADSMPFSKVINATGKNVIICAISYN
jgi:hypothetical protein